MSESVTFEQFVSLQLGVSDTEIELGTRAETRYATDMMAGQANNSLEIFSRDLDPFLYDREPFLEALSRLCLRNRKAQVRVLVQDPVTPVKRNHRLIELARRLSSSIELRQPHSDYQTYNEAFLIADHCGIIHRGLADRFEGTARFYDPVEAQRKLKWFTEIWERSQVHPEFRRLHL
jgi:hypothetical protein